jgi:hypothetical protein
VSALAALQRDFLGALPPVHRRNVAANLHDALAAAYPVTRRLVGDAFFAEMAARFADAHPCRDADLHRYGASLAQFVGTYGPAAALPYLPDVARLEWACHTAAFAADAPAMDYAGLERLTSEDRIRVRFTLQPAARLFTSPFRVAAIWHANQPGADGVVGEIDRQEWLVVHRRDNLVEVQVLARPEFDFLALLQAGLGLDEASASLAQADLAPVLGDSLPRFVAAGLICGFRAQASRPER